MLWITPLVFLMVTGAHPQYAFAQEHADNLVDGLGLLLVLLGIAMRVCARGWKYENGRRGVVTDGLYGYVRHPLYVASFLIGLGICVIIGVLWYALLFVACFWAVHLPVIRKEEKKLASRWPEVHAAYRHQVPALLPSLRQLRQRSSIRPRRLAPAIRREADAVCGWTLLGLGLEVWEDVSAARVPWHRLVEVDAMLLLILAGGIVWLILKFGSQGERPIVDRPAA